LAQASLLSPTFCTLHVRTPQCMQFVVKWTLEQQFLDCFSVQQVRAVSSEFSCVRSQTEYHTHTALSIGAHPAFILQLPFALRIGSFPLPDEVLAGNVPHCGQYTALGYTGAQGSRGFFRTRGIFECSCIIIRRRQIRLEELFWHRQLRRVRRTSGLLRGESVSSSES